MTGMNSLREIIEYRELVKNMVSRDLKIKYKGSVLGFLWSLITPLLQMLIYTVVFSVIIRIKVDWPFAVFLLTGAVARLTATTGPFPSAIAWARA